MQRYGVASKPQHLLLFLLAWTASISCRSAAVTSISTPPTSPLVCPYRTVNHITHSLAQRCLPTSRTVRSNATKIEASISSETTSQTSKVVTTATDSTISHSTLAPTVDEGHSAANNPAVIQPTTSAIVSEEEADLESPLGKDHFLSFEEWRKQNLDKYGQSPDQIGKSKKHENLQARRPPINVLDSLGDDEINLDFSGFASDKPQVAVPSHKDAPNTEAGTGNRGKEVPKARTRSKGAGTTFKERFNYASFDCAATILKTNAKSSGTSAVLVENKDSYMLNECSVEDKFLILELCEDILIDTIVLANFEFFSSIFRTFRVSVSDRYPVKLEKWKTLGTFEARNTREVQAFLVDNPLIWTKYVRIEFMTHYGNEFYCPVSLVRVHGTTMLEDYRHDEEPSKAEDRDDEDDQVTDGSGATETTVAEAVADVLVEEESTIIAAQQNHNLNAAETALQDVKQPLNKTASFPYDESNASNVPAPEILRQSLRNATMSLLDLTQHRCLANETETDPEIVSSTARVSELSGTPKTPLPAYSTTTRHDTAERQEQQSSTTISQSTTHQYSSKSIADDPPEKSSTTKQSVQPSDSILSSKTSNSQGSDGSRTPASSTQPPPSNPTVQESFFKSVQKRLQMLESNSTLSLQYIEEQSRILRDAFSKVEQRQLSKTTKFLDYLNETVLNELRDFRQQYDQLWQSTITELDAQRELNQHEVIAMNTRFSILADELVFQKRMAILQSILVLICIGLVLFSRGAVTSYLDHPLLQNMLTRSATLKMRGSFLDTPSLSPESTRPNSSYKPHTKTAESILKGHRRNLSEGSQDGVDNPAIAYSPPTPASNDGQSEVEDREDEHVRHQSPPRSLANARRSRISPPIVHQHADDPDTPPRKTEGKDDQRRSSTLHVNSAHTPNDGISQPLDEEQHVSPSEHRQQAPNG